MYKLNMKVILNKCYGGFIPSVLAHKEYAKKKGFEAFPYKLNVKDHNFLKQNPSCSDAFVIYSNKDLGSNTSSIPDDCIFSLSKEESRFDPTLIEVVEELGTKANSYCSKLQVFEVPDELKDNYKIDSYDGYEFIHQKVEEW